MIDIDRVDDIRFFRGYIVYRDSDRNFKTAQFCTTQIQSIDWLNNSTVVGDSNDRIFFTYDSDDGNYLFSISTDLKDFKKDAILKSENIRVIDSQDSLYYDLMGNDVPFIGYALVVGTLWEGIKASLITEYREDGNYGDFESVHSLVVGDKHTLEMLEYHRSFPDSD